MAGLMALRGMAERSSGVRRYLMLHLLLGMLLLMPSLVHAQESWFYRDNQIAYRMYQAGQYRQALAHWDKSAQGWFGRGSVLMKMGRMHEAEQAFRRSLALMPEIEAAGSLEGPPGDDAGFIASIWYNLGNCLYAQEALRPASKAWRSALNYEPEHAKARHNLEIVERLLGKAEEPEETLQGLTQKAKEGGERGSSARSETSGQDAHAKKQQKQEASIPHDRERKKQARSENGGSGRDGKQQGGGQDASRFTAANSHGRNSNEAGKGAPPHTEGISAQQAEHELRLVEEGVSVFLRHRLNEKGHGSPAYRGPAW